jgi:hypothetical protein
VNFQQLVSEAEGKAANQGYDVAKLPVVDANGDPVETVMVKPVKVGSKSRWVVQVRS